MHIHINSPDGEAKFWLEPKVELAKNVGFNQKQIKVLENIIEENIDEIKNRWKEHFGS